MPVVFFLNKLRDGVPPEEYEQWVREVDYPTARALPQIKSYVVAKIDGTLDGEPPLRYIERVEITDIEPIPEALATPRMEDFSPSGGLVSSANRSPSSAKRSSDEPARRTDSLRPHARPARRVPRRRPAGLLRDLATRRRPGRLRRLLGRRSHPPARRGDPRLRRRIQPRRTARRLDDARLSRGRTRRVRLGTEVTPVTLRHPCHARQVRSPRSMSSVAAASSSAPAPAGTSTSSPRLGIPFERRDERYAKIVRSDRGHAGALAATGVDFDGQLLSTDRRRPRPKPVQPGGPPIWFGGFSDQFLDRHRPLRRRLDPRHQPRPRLRRRAPGAPAQTSPRPPAAIPRRSASPCPLMAHLSDDRERARASLEGYIARGDFGALARRLLRRERPPLRPLGHARRRTRPSPTLPRPRRPRLHLRPAAPGDRPGDGRAPGRTDRATPGNGLRSNRCPRPTPRAPEP